MGAYVRKRELTVDRGWGRMQSASHRGPSIKNCMNNDGEIHLKARTWNVSTLSLWERQRPGKNILGSLHMTKDDKTQLQVYSLAALVFA